MQTTTGDTPTTGDDALTTDDVATCAPRRGRPRNEEADDAILQAVLQLVREVGLRSTSMDEVARLAGVSKATIYRRWDSKEAMVLAALRSAIGPYDDIDTGELATDVRTYLTEMARKFNASTNMSEVLPHLIEAAFYDDEIRTSLGDYVQFRRGPLVGMLERGRDRGELPADTDIEVLADAILGPITYRRLLRTGPLDGDYVDRLLRITLPGV